MIQYFFFLIFLLLTPPGPLGAGVRRDILAEESRRQKYENTEPASPFPEGGADGESALREAPFETGAVERLSKAVQKLEKRGKRDPLIAKKICRARENLGRLQLLSSDLGSRYLLINIPDFRLWVIENDQPVMTMKVVLGSVSQPSPTLSAAMTYLVFNPHWRVPHSIAVRDKLPMLKKDPHYLEKQGMKLYEEATDVDGQLIEAAPLTVNWQTVSADNFPYRLIQDPGDLNLLGHVKFMFHNNYDVYLHDTPEKNLFGYQVRAFSSGCFRIEKPVDLAEYLLRSHSGWDRSAIIDAMNAGIQQEVGLKKPIPIHIIYITAWADRHHQLQFRPDIYKKDKCY